MCAQDETTGRETYDICHYDGSKLVLRGPERSFDEPFIAVLGGSETYGKFVRNPYPHLLEDWIGVPVVNLGVMHAGVSLFSNERWLLDIASRAKVTVIQIMGAQNMSNRLYCVHPRRNDRFLTSSDHLRQMYPEIDFTEFNFTGHLLSGLSAGSPDRFAVVVEELRWAWVQRMRRVLTTITGNVVLLWMSDHSPDDAATDTPCADPAFVNRAMLDEIGEFASGLVEVVRPSREQDEAGVPFGCAQGDATLHARIAETLAGPVSGFVEGHGKALRRSTEDLSDGSFPEFRASRSVLVLR